MSYQSIDKIAVECNGIGAIVGAPFRNPSPKGKNLFNSAWLLADGKVQDVVHKSLLPNYDVFDEYRYFEPNHKVTPVTFGGINIALTICEDIWDVGDDPLYIAAPMDELVEGGCVIAAVVCKCIPRGQVDNVSRPVVVSMGAVMSYVST